MGDRATLLRALATSSKALEGWDAARVVAIADLLGFEGGEGPVSDDTPKAPPAAHEPGSSKPPAPQSRPDDQLLREAGRKPVYWVVETCEAHAEDNAEDNAEEEPSAFPRIVADSTSDQRPEPLPVPPLRTAGQWQNLWD
ncbi:MAG: hypothetical protein ACPGUC_09935, partial [Gammaproteobacteria bacterium]